MNQHSEIRGVVRRSNAMRKYGALILVAAVFCAILAVTPRTAHACSQGEYRHLSEYADDVELAFAGHQLRRIVPASNEEAWKPWSVTLVFQVDQVYKGQAGPQVEVRTNQGSAACGLDLSGAGVTGIAAFPTKEGLRVDTSSPITIAELEEVFGEGYPADLKAEAWDPGDDVWAPATNSTSPPATNSTSPPATNSTSPPATNSTSPPATNSTSPPLASQEPDTKHLPNEEGPIRILIVAGTIVILGGGAVVFLKRRRTQE